jgi:hypothetical protein
VAAVIARSPEPQELGADDGLLAGRGTLTTRSPGGVPARWRGYISGMAKDHGSSVKDDKQYEGLRKRGMSKERAAKIANTPNASKKGGESRGGGGGNSRAGGGTKKQKSEAGKKGGKKSSS